VFILKGDKVLCFHTLLQVLILKVDSGIAGALAQFLALLILLQTIFLGNVGRKGVRWLVGYFMIYYTIWLAPVKRIFVPFWDWNERTVFENRDENLKRMTGGNTQALLCVDAIAVDTLHASLYEHCCTDEKGFLHRKVLVDDDEVVGLAAFPTNVEDLFLCRSWMEFDGTHVLQAVER
jgi:hypothetical protein